MIIFCNRPLGMQKCNLQLGHHEDCVHLESAGLRVVAQIHDSQELEIDVPAASKRAQELGVDLYTYVAAFSFRVTYARVTEQQREHVKRILFSSAQTGAP